MSCNLAVHVFIKASNTDELINLNKQTHSICRTCINLTSQISTRVIAGNLMVLTGYHIYCEASLMLKGVHVAFANQLLN